MPSRREAALLSPSTQDARSPSTQDVSTRRGCTAGTTRILLAFDDASIREEETRGLLVLLVSMGEHLLLRRQIQRIYVKA